MSLQDQIEAGVPGEPLVLTYTVLPTPEYETLYEYYDEEYRTISATVYYDPDFYGTQDLEELAASRAQIRYDEDRDDTPIPMETNGDLDDLESTYVRCKRIEDRSDFIAWD